MIIQKIKKKFRQLKDPGSQGEKRSSQWPKVRKAFLITHQECAACGETRRRYLEVHHIESFHLHPEKELEESNFIVLCRKGRNHHFQFGHGENFKQENPSVEKDAKYYRKMIERVKIKS